MSGDMEVIKNKIILISLLFGCHLDDIHFNKHEPEEECEIIITFLGWKGEPTIIGEIETAEYGIINSDNSQDWYDIEDYECDLGVCNLPCHVEHINEDPDYLLVSYKCFYETIYKSIYLEDNKKESLTVSCWN